jgi:DNA-binding winged helix-turn-helix (wHTH) protein/Tol biopolymer transport system component
MAGIETPHTSPAAAGRRYAFGPFILDVAARSVVRGPDTIALPSRAFDTLVYLIEHRDRLVDKEELLTAVWSNVIVTDDSLIHAVSVLRRSLHQATSPTPLIATIPRRGYRFVHPVQIVADDPSTDAAVVPPATAGALERAAPVGAPRRWSFGWMAAAAVGALGVAFVSFGTLRPPTSVTPPDPAIRLFQPPPAGTDIVSGGVLSPDARYIAFIARDRDSGQTALWVRRLQAGDAERVKDTDGASKPFWSPDSRHIAFFTPSRIGIVDLERENAWSLPSVETSVAGGTWGADDTILFADWATGLYSVAASGDGGVRRVKELDHGAQEIAYTWPQFLPDGRRFIYHAASLDVARSGIYLGSLDSDATQFVLETQSPAVFAPPSHLVHVQNGMLIAEEIDFARLEPTGRSIVLARDVAPPSLGDGDIVSASGNLVAFRDGRREQNLAWFARSGEQLESLPVPTTLFNPRISPDESQMLATSAITTDPGLWIASMSRAQYTRLETDAIAPLWSPDGERVAFTSRGGAALLIRRVAEQGVAKPVLPDGPVKILNDWSPDGATIVYTQSSAATKLDLWTLTLDDERPAPLLATPFNEMQARLSPDGRWIAYVSDVTGTLEVYVSRYPALDDPQRVSTAGGGQPQWRADQRELFFVSADRALMAADVTTNGPSLSIASPRALFRPPIGGGPADAREFYAVAAGGQRFLIDSSASSEVRAPITVMVNWAGATAEARVDTGMRLSRLTD